MEDDLITTKEVGDYRIKVYYCHDSECPITNWGLFGSFFFEYSDMHRLHDECNWKTFFYDNKHDLRDVIDAIVMKHIKQKDIVKYLKKVVWIGFLEVLAMKISIYVSRYLSINHSEKLRK